MDYMLKRWDTFSRFLHDGRICLSNNAAERALRGVALGRKAWLFAGSDRGGERAAAIYSLIVTAKLNDVDPRAWLADVLRRIQATPRHGCTNCCLGIGEQQGSYDDGYLFRMVLRMSADKYMTDEGFRGDLHAEILRTIEELRTGKVGVIAASRTLGRYTHVIEGRWPELATALRVFVGIDSETDALPIGHLRSTWHPHTVRSEDQKVHQAEKRWKPHALEACNEITRLLTR